MRDKGIKHLNHSGRGDQIVRILVNIPQRLSNKEKELLKELADQPNFRTSDKENDKGFFKRFGL
ncbi:MAG: hypothetical protein ABI638_05190 [Ignavibacteriota bacterium]